MNASVEVQALGQSIWTDYISRRWLEDGTLAHHIETNGVVGVTSNPTIFQNAIGKTTDYDAQIAEHLDADANTIYEALVVRDIQQAADLLRPVFDKTGGADGYVSLEVNPLLAHNTDDTVAEAKRLYAALDRPNVMIKIPATAAGLPAIEQVIAAGINVNVTLIFSVANYEEVAEAYLKGLEARLAAGKSLAGIASVASFFLSRIDVMVDRALQNNILAATGRDLDRVSSNRKLLGRTAIANAKIAYARFRVIFSGERWQRLQEAGASVQRPLWASASTKDPAYPDTMYVDELIGKDTVNTLPPPTLEAFVDHGTVAETLTTALGDANVLMDQLKTVGVDIDNVTKRLQADGVDAFIDSFEMLIAQVDAKRIVLKTGIIDRQKVAFGIYRTAVEHALTTMQKDVVDARIWAKDATVWKDRAEVMTAIRNRLGWLDILDTIDIDRLKTLQANVGDVSHVVLLGMGGSSLAPEVLYKSFGPQAGFPELLVLDNTDPTAVQAVVDAVDLPKTLFIVASKSGGTLETMSFFHYFYQLTGENGAQFIAITDPNTPLQRMAEENGFRDVFLNPADIGGRYSALSYFGMVPAALIGLDLDKLWHYATLMIEACGENIPSQQHPGMWLGVFLGALAQENRDKVCIFACDSIASFGDWAEQLIAESTGKQGRGIIPVVNATVGMPHDYSTDRNFVYLKVDGDPSTNDMDEKVKAIREAGHPRMTLLLPEPEAIAGEFFRWEFATAIAGKMLGINPFDEPNVTESKENTNALLAHYEEHGALPSSEPRLKQENVGIYADEDTMRPLYELCAQHGYDANSIVETLAAQIVGTHAGDYFALLVYAHPNETTGDKLRNFARRVRHVTKRAVTVGYGPRYLHSTGQLHKGGANNGVYFQLTYPPPTDLDIPGAGYSFGILFAAQAEGDFQSLSRHNRRALRLHSDGDNVDAAIDLLARAIEVAAERRK